MEIVIPVRTEIDYTVSGNASGLSTWSSASVAYVWGDRVYYPLSAGGTGHNHTSIRAHTSSTSRKPTIGSNYYWKDDGPAEGEVSTYLTDYELSWTPDWASGDAIVKGNRVFDDQSLREYVALVSLTSGENTTRPSVALESADEDMATRWYDLGPANAFRLMDPEILTRTIGYESAEVTMRAHGACDRLVLAGMIGVASVDISVTNADAIPNPDFDSAAIAHWMPGQSGDVSISHASGQMTVANADYATEAGYAAFLCYGLIEGVEYEFSADITAGACQLLVRSGDGQTTEVSSTLTSATATVSVTWEASGSMQRLLIYLPVGTQTVTLTAVSCLPTTLTSITDSVSLAFAGGGYKRTIKYTHAIATHPRYVLTINQADDVPSHEVGLIFAGTANEIGCTRTDIVDEYDDYSRIVFDETYGLGSFLQRGFSRRFEAIIQLPGRTGGEVMALLRSLRAVPALYDLGGDSYTEGDAMLHGIAENVRRINTGLSSVDTLSLSLKGLVE
jgi:hypothetical protein